MKKLLFFTLITYFTAVQLTAADIPNADDLCYDKDQVFTEGTGCVDFGPFSGGFNCKKTIPLRNISDDTLSNVNILWDIDDGFDADFVESCGIDGRNEEGGACNFNARIRFGPFDVFEDSILFDPMPDFTASGDASGHSIYLYNLMAGRVDPFVFFRDGALQANYTKDGDTYTGTVKPCERRRVKVDHLCYDYDAITYDNSFGLGICMDFGPFKGGFACKQNIPIRSLTDQVISDIDIVLDQHGMNGSMLDDCGIDGSSKKASGECQDRTLFNFGPMGMMARGFMFDMPDYDAPFEKHSIFTRSLMSMKMDPISFFTGENMYTHYSINGQKYDGYIPACHYSKEPVKDLCYDYEAITYDGVACVDFGPFQGGVGCKQTIPIRSSSNTPLTQVDILLDEHGMNGNFLGGCGVDDHSGFFDQTCKELHAFDFGPMGMFSKGVLFDPMATYAPFEEHSIYVSAGVGMSADPVALFRGENLLTHYVKDGNLTSGKIPACKRNYADDLCYEDPTFRGICFGFFNAFCTQTVPIKNQRSNVLTDVSIIHKVNLDLFGFAEGCGIDGNAGNCSSQEAIDLPFSNFFGAGTLFKPLPDYTAGAQHTIYEYATFSMMSFAGGTLVGTFLRNEEWFSTELAACLPDSQLSLMTGTFGAWDNYRVGIHGTGDRHIATKIVNKPFTLAIASINDTQDAYEAKNVSTDIAYGLIEPDGTSFIVDGGSFDASKVTLFEHEFTVSGAYRELEVGFRLCSEISDGDLILHDSAACAAVEVLACDDARAGTHWRMCPSDDSFSVRPDHFTFKLPFMTDNSTLRSGETYKYEITAKDYAGNPTSGYNQSGGNLDDDNATILFSDASDNNGSLNGIIDYDGSSFNFVNGVSDEGGDSYAAGISFDDVATLSLIIQDTEWTSVDSEDTPDSCDGGIKNGVNVKNGRFICGLTRPTFIPHHFALKNVTLHNHDNGTFTYLSKDTDPGDPNNDIAMSAHIGLKIVAENKNNFTTENFRKGSLYYENPVNIAFTPLHPITVAGIDRVPYQHDMDDVRALVAPVSLGFGDLDANGEYTLAWNTNKLAQKLNFNFNKDYSAPLRPFTVNMTDLNVTVTSKYGSKVIKGATADAPGQLSGKANFQYARVAATRPLFDDVTTLRERTPITAQVFCPLDIVECSIENIDTTNGRTTDSDWWLSTTHQQSRGDGNIRLASTTSRGTASLEPANVNIESAGIQHNVFVKYEGPRPQTVHVGLDAAGTSAWMFTDDMGYDVHFTGNAGWAGQGPTGYIIDSNASSKGSRRIGW